MNKVSLELAKQLKEAGLKWEPELGQWFIGGDFGTTPAMIWKLFDKLCPEFVVEKPELFIWLPTLSDILDELEKMGYCADVCSFVDDGNKVTRYCELIRIETLCILDLFEADSYEDAAGLALLWALENKDE